MDGLVWTSNFYLLTRLMVVVSEGFMAASLTLFLVSLCLVSRKSSSAAIVDSYGTSYLSYKYKYLVQFLSLVS